MVRRLLPFTVVVALVACGCGGPREASGVPLKDQLKTAAGAGNAKRAKAIAFKLIPANPSVQDFLNVEDALHQGAQGLSDRRAIDLVAAAVIDRSLRQFPGLDQAQKVELYEHLALDYFTGEDLLMARKTFEEALAYAPDSDLIQNDYAYFIAECGGDLHHALVMARFSHDRNPGRMDTRDTLGWVLLKNGDVQGAIPLLQEAASNSGAYSDVHFHLAQAYEAAGRKADAAKEYVKVVKGRATSRTIKPRSLDRLRVLDQKAYAEVTKLPEEAPSDKPGADNASPFGGASGK